MRVPCQAWAPNPGAQGNLGAVIHPLHFHGLVPRHSPHPNSRPPEPAEQSFWPGENVTHLPRTDTRTPGVGKTSV